MHPSFSAPVRAIAAALLIAASVEPSFAACTRLGFSVNDYGKDGPTKDAKGLLDKYIAKWATDHGVPKYRTGTKEVKCELFLNFIVFDEHTCRAEATVCWDGAPVTPAVKAEGAPSDVAKPGAPKAPALKRAAVTTPLKPNAPSAAATKPAATPVASSPIAPAIETGTLPAVAKPNLAAPVPAPIATPKPAAATESTGDQALAAAQKAAAAAERAAAAAERAAAAAAAAERASLPATAAKP